MRIISLTMRMVLKRRINANLDIRRYMLDYTSSDTHQSKSLQDTDIKNENSGRRPVIRSFGLGYKDSNLE